ncbi:hypothetical protein MBLNU459_g0417t1 [Dothideomycetes sp. NU459]
MGSSRRNKQTQLSFTPLPSSSPASAAYNQQVRDRAAAVRFDGSPSPAKRRKIRDAPKHSSLSAPVDLTNDTLPLTPELTAPNESQVSLGGHSISDGDQDGAIRLSSRKSTKQKRKQKRLDFAPSSPAAQRAVNTVRPVTVGFFGTQSHINLDSSDAASSDEEVSLPKALPRSSKTRSSSPLVQEQPIDARLASDNFVNLGSEKEESGDDDDTLPTTPAARRRRHAVPSRKNSEDKDMSSFIADDEEEEEEEDEDSDDVVVIGSRKRQLSSKKRAFSDSAEEPSSDEGMPSRSTKRLRRTREPTITEEERREIEEDVLDLASSGSDTEVRLQPRKQNAVRSAREQALAKLKAKREGGGTRNEAGETRNEDGNIEDDGEGSPRFEDQIYQDDNGSEDRDDEDEAQFLPTPSSRKMFQQDDEDDSFVVQDDDAEIGAPTGLPLEFTHWASMRAKELFKYAVEWMVQKKINPAFQIDDEIYDLAFKKLDDYVKGLAGSKFTSAAWTQDFTFALQARPEILASRLDRLSGDNFMRDKCDACNRSGHPATFEVRFEGRPYHPQTLEELATANDSSSDSGSDSETGDESNYNFKGHKILPEDTVFYLGKFCMKNAETAHALHHWRVHLYQWVVEYLETAGYNTPANIVKRDKWSTGKRRKYSNKIVDAMHADGKIKDLYRDFESQVDTARNSTQQGRWNSSP